MPPPAADQRFPILLCTPKKIFPRGFLQISKDGLPLYDRWVGIPKEPTWDELCGFLEHSYESHPQWYPDLNHAKQEHGAWANGRYTGDHKLNNNWLGARALIFDIDHCTSREQVKKAFSGTQRIVHTSLKHRPEKPRYRVVLPLLDECTDRAAFRRVHAGIIEWFVNQGLFGEHDIDAAGGDAARAWFLPMHQPDVVPEFQVIRGNALDWRTLLSRLPPEPIRAPASYHVGSAIDAIKRAIDGMSSVPHGERHLALCSWCGRLKSIGLNADDVMPLLLPAVTLDEKDRRNNERTIRGLMGSGSSATQTTTSHDKHVEDI